MPWGLGTCKLIQKCFKGGAFYGCGCSLGGRLEEGPCAERFSLDSIFDLRSVYAGLLGE